VFLFGFAFILCLKPQAANNIHMYYIGIDKPRLTVVVVVVVFWWISQGFYV